MKKIILFCFLIVNGVWACAQQVGAYRSVASGNWTSSSTWERWDGATWQPNPSAPVTTDDTITIRNTHTVDITTAISIDQVIVEAGATLNITGSVTLNNGVGNDLVNNGTLNLGNVFSFNSSTLVNNGTTNWNTGNINLSSGTLVNNAQISDNATANHSFTSTGGTNQFTNNGTFTKAGNATTTIIGIPATNSGTLQINSNTLSNTGAMTNTGVISIGGSGAFTLSAGSLNLNTGSSIQGSGSFNQTNGTTNVNTDLAIASGVICNISAGTTAGSGILTILGTLNCSGGTLGSPFVIAASTGIMNISNGITINGGSLTNNGNIYWSAGNITLTNATLTNNAQFTDTSVTAHSFSSGGGTNLFTNTGTFTKLKGTLNTTVGLPSGNSGTLQINTGGLTNNSALTNSGPIAIATNCVFTQNTGSLTLNSGSSFSGNGSLNLSGGIINVNVNLTLPSTTTCNISGGSTTAGSGILTIQGTMNGSGGILGSPFAIAASTGVLNITNTISISSASLTNNGIIYWSAGNISLTNGNLVNNNQFNDTATAAHSINSGGGTNLFTNSGTFTKSLGTANTTVGVPSSNSGTLQINTGGYINTSTMTNSGPIATVTNSVFTQNAGSLILNSGSSLSGNGSVNLSFGTITLNTAINSPASLTVNLASASTNGLGIFTLNGTMNWSGGTIGSPFIVATSAVLNITNTVSLSGASLTNDGNLYWSAGSISLTNGNLVNNNQFNDTATAAHSINSGGGTNLFTNSGTFTKSLGTANTTVGVPSSNSGTLQINTGGYINTSTMTNSGPIATVTNSVFTQNAGSLILNSGSSFSGNGSFNHNGGTSTINANINIPATISINFVGGSTTGSGKTTVQGTMNWSAGSLGSEFIVASLTGVLNISNGVTISGDTLTNNGNIYWASGNIFLINGILLNNNQINDTSSVSHTIGSGGGTNAFLNTGTFLKSNGSLSTNISIPSVNSGTYQVNSGTLINSNVLTNTGIFNIATGSIFQQNNNVTFNTGSTITGSGSFNYTGGNSTLNTDISMPETIVFNYSGGNIMGSNTVTVMGTMNWSGGSLTCPLVIDKPNGILNITIGVSLQKTLLNKGILNWNSGNINLINGTITNDSVLNANGNGQITLSGGTNLITNNGIFRKTDGSGTTTIGIPFVNNATVKGVGILNITNTFTNNGNLEPGLSPGILVLNNAQPLSASSTLGIELQDGSGPGTGHDQLQRAGNLTLNGTLTAVETGSVPAGTYTIISLSSGTISGNFSTVNLPSNYTITVNASNVTLTKASLPVTWIYFRYEKNYKSITLQWQTGTESNSDYFAVERSRNGVQFEEIGRKKAAGNSTTATSYSFQDGNPLSGSSYYRLRQLDKDGKFMLSKVLLVNFRSGNPVTLAPNPVHDMLTVNAGFRFKSLEIWDITGKRIRQYAYRASGQYNLTDLPSGTYVVQIIGAEINLTTRILKL